MRDVDYSVFLHLLRAKRIASGVTQNQIAERLKKPQSFVSKCESGSRRMDVLTLVRYCQAMDVPVDSFMSELKELLSESN